MKKRILLGFALFSIVSLLSFLIYITVIFAGNYAIDNKKLVMDSATTLVDQNGEIVTKLYIENREIVQISDIPPHVQNAFIAIEDARFLKHRGIDYKAIGRAIYRDIVARSKVEGASTITQQLVKNTFLTSEKTLLRKTKEVLIAMNLERKYSKEEILEMYLNRIYFGHGAYGIQAASNLYFNKDVSELTVEEGALLAGLPKAPNTYSPINNLEMSRKRRDLVLSVMEQNGYLNAEETLSLQRKNIVVDLNKITEEPAYLTYIDMVLEEAESLYQISSEEILRGGYTIVVPMNQGLQQDSYEILKDEENFPDSGPNQEIEAAFMLMDNETGGVIAVHGGRNYVRKGLNRVNSKRQPGSTIKPLVVYAPALETDLYEPYSLLKDEQADYDGYKPRNYNHKYSGLITMYDAIKDSTNAPAVWLLNELMVEKGKKYLEDVNITLPDNQLSVALGGLTEGISPIELTKAYRPFANEGKVIEPYFIEEIYNRHGEIIARANKGEKQVVSAQTAWYMTRMLEAVVNDGTAQAGDSTHPLAGKTGTTSYKEVEGAVRDAWFVGFTPDVVGSLWIGYDRTDKEHYLTVGSSLPTKLFKEIINQYSSTAVSFEKPNNVNELEEPIRLAKINNLTADLSFLTFGFGVKLNWQALDDERVIYHIYEVSDNQYVKIDQVVEAQDYIVRNVNPFSLKQYVIRPFNPQTGLEGEESNIAEVSLPFLR